MPGVLPCPLQKYQERRTCVWYREWVLTAGKREHMWRVL